ncbi:UNVERIFIED_CONTAM: hypothetical protein Sindi_1822800 [Sesamum indicum]
MEGPLLQDLPKGLPPVNQKVNVPLLLFPRSSSREFLKEASHKLHGGSPLTSFICASFCPSFKEEMDTTPRSSRTSSTCIHSRQSLDQERGRNPLVVYSRRGVLSLGDKQLLVPFLKEEFEGMGVYYLLKVATTYEELSSKPQGEAKKEVTGRFQQLEKDIKKLQKEVVNHESALEKAMENAIMDFPHSEEGKNYLEAYWKSRLKELKKSKRYQQEVAKIAGPYFEHSFTAYKKRRFRQFIGGDRGEVRSPHNEPAIDSIAGDLQGEVALESKDEETPLATDAKSPATPVPIDH